MKKIIFSISLFAASITSCIQCSQAEEYDKKAQKIQKIIKRALRRPFTSVIDLIEMEKPGNKITERRINDLSLQEAQNLKEKYKKIHFHILIPNYRGSSIEWDCFEEMETAYLVPKIRNMTLITSAIFFAGATALLCMFRNLVVVNRGAVLNNGRYRLQKATKAFSLLSASILSSVMAIPLALAAYEIHTNGLPDTPSGFCDYPQKCLEALDQRIEELSKTSNHTVTTEL